LQWSACLAPKRPLTCTNTRRRTSESLGLATHLPPHGLAAPPAGRRRAPARRCRRFLALNLQTGDRHLLIARYLTGSASSDELFGVNPEADCSGWASRVDAFRLSWGFVLSRAIGCRRRLGGPLRECSGPQPQRWLAPSRRPGVARSRRGQGAATRRGHMSRVDDEVVTAPGPPGQACPLPAT
jgi:hypothetical protein